MSTPFLVVAGCDGRALGILPLNHVDFAPPAIGKIANLARPGLVQKLESVMENREVLSHVERFTEGMTERPAKEKCARRFYLFGHIAQDGNGNGGNSGGFDGPLNQSHGPIAEPSSRGEKHEIWLFRSQIGKQLWKHRLLESGNMGPVNVPHERIVVPCHTADLPGRSEFAHAVQWQEDVEIAVGIPMVVIVVRDRQVVCAGVARNDPIRWVSLGIVHVKWTVAAKVKPSGGDQADSALSQRFVDWSPRNIGFLFDMREFAPEASNEWHAREQLC